MKNEFNILTKCPRCNAEVRCRLLKTTEDYGKSLVTWSLEGQCGHQFKRRYQAKK